MYKHLFGIDKTKSGRKLSPVMIEGLGNQEDRRIGLSFLWLEDYVQWSWGQNRDVVSELVVGNVLIKILWDITIQTDHPLEANKPDIVLLNKEDNSCWIVDVACPFDTRVVGKEKEKVEKYQDLKREIQRMWKCKTVKIIPIVIGALGTMSKQFSRWLQLIGMTNYLAVLQKACLLGTARILRKVLDMEC